MIDPASVAFDIDGVIADTMTLFIDIARDEFGLDSIKYEDVSSYTLKDCLDIDEEILDAVVEKLLNGEYSATLKPIKGAADVLARLSVNYGPVVFVTARPYLGPLKEWIPENLRIDSALIDVVATGSFDAKADELLKRNISYFVEDRLETCFLLRDAGIKPIIFKQPWNRSNRDFPEAADWRELETLIDFTG